MQNCFDLLISCKKIVPLHDDTIVRNFVHRNDVRGRLVVRILFTTVAVVSLIAHRCTKCK